MVTGTKNAPADSSLVMQTPEGIAFVLYPAGIPVRACAWAIDTLIQWVLIFAVYMSLLIMSDVMGIWLALILAFALDWFYHTVFEVFWRGQSPGKRIMGIRVVRGDGSPVDPGSSFLRNLLRFADSFMFLYLIAFVCMMVSPGFRRFGDWAADTLVVYAARVPGRFVMPAHRQPAMPWLEDVAPAYPSRRLSYREKQAILMFARRYPLLGKARADEIAETWADELQGTAKSLVPKTDASVSDAEPSSSKAELSSSAYFLGIARTLGG